MPIAEVPFIKILIHFCKKNSSVHGTTFTETIVHFVLFHVNCETFSIFQADILHVKSGFDLAVFYRANHGTEKSFQHYGTPGLEEEFVRGKSEFTQTV